MTIDLSDHTQMSPPTSGHDNADHAAQRSHWRFADRLVGRRADAVALAGYILGALWLTAHLWTGLGHRGVSAGPTDESFNEWMYSYAAYALVHLENPFYTVLHNAPVGVNLMSNVGSQLPAWPLAPVTLLAGAHVTFVIITTGNLAATGAAWYFFLSRRVVRSRVAAFLGGAFCAFSPGMMSQTAGAHPHITAQYLVPVILWQVFALREPGPRLRRAIITGVLIAAQVFVGEEILLFTALAGGVVVVAYVTSRPAAVRREARQFLVGLAITGAVALVFVAYPLWFQFFGPGRYHGFSSTFWADLASYPAYARQSLGGDAAVASRLAPNPTEENTFFGWPLLVLVAVVGLWLWRDLAARLAFVTAVVTGALSLGNRVIWNGRMTHYRGPWVLFSHLPLFDTVIVSRIALVTASAVGVLLAVAADRLIRIAPAVERPGFPVRLLAAGTAAAVLLPVAPHRLGTAPRPHIPRFVTSGHWRQYIAPGRTFVVVPIGATNNANTTGLEWATAARLGFGVPQGSFLGPTGPHDLTARWLAPEQPTEVLLTKVANGTPISIGPAEREQARRDVRFWRADAVTLAPNRPHEAELKDALNALFGPAQRVDDLWIWDVRHF